MWKIVVFLSLLCAYLAYSMLIFTNGTSNSVILSETEKAKASYGKALFQQHNCIACHQLFGLGGYLGPDLTTACSDPQRGESYIKAFLQSGGRRMPNFHFSPEETETLVSFFRYVDQAAKQYPDKK